MGSAWKNWSGPWRGTTHDREIAGEHVTGDDDVIDLGAIDADKNTAGDQAFRFGGRDGAPELREVSWFRGGGEVVVAFNDGRRVGQVELDGFGAAPDAGDFLL